MASRRVVAAVEQGCPRSLRQPCLVHKKRNILDKLPEQAQAEVKHALHAVYEASNREVADLLAADFIDRYATLYPSTVACFQDDLDASLAFLKCPPSHHMRIRSTSLLERAFLEERWRSVRMSHLECQQLDLLRRELKLDETDADALTVHPPIQTVAA